MGCTESRHHVSEEQAILQAEASLGLQVHHVRKLDMNLRKFSSGGLINPAQFQKLTDLLHLPVDSSSVVSNYFRKFRNQDGCVLLREFLVAALLLGLGPASIKAALLFQVFDEQATGSLSLEQLRSVVFPVIVGQALRLACLVEPLPAKVSTYCDNLASVQKEAITRVVDKLNNRGESHIRESRFVAVLSDLLDGALTSATGWRTFLHEVYVTLPPKQPLEHPFLQKYRREKPSQT